jgi:RNA polymerase sigma-70 factor (ECF subfamily)
MQAGSDAPPSHAGRARTAEGARARGSHSSEAAALRLPEPDADARPPESGVDARPPDSGLAPLLPEVETAPRPAEAGFVAPTVLQVAAVAASRLATEGPPQPFELTEHDDYELAVPEAHVPPAVAPMPEPDSDEALMVAFAAGEAEAFSRLYDRHERSTWRFIRHRLGRAHEAAADDVMQEAWISVARAAPRYVPSARFTTWLFAIARSRAVDYLRAQAHATLSLDAPLEGAAEGTPGSWAEELPADAAHEPPVRVESRQQAVAFLEALAQLPALQREAFVLQAEAGLSVEEIGRATGVGAETAKTRLRYARARLRALLAGWRPT